MKVVVRGADTQKKVRKAVCLATKMELIIGIEGGQESKDMYYHNLLSSTVYGDIWPWVFFIQKDKNERNDRNVRQTCKSTLCNKSTRKCE